MAYALPSDIEQIVKQKVASGKYRDVDAVLRAAFAALSEAESDLEAIQEAIGKWKAGDEGLPVEDAFAEICAMHHGPPQQ